MLEKRLLKSKKYKYYTFLCMLYITALAASDVVVYKLFGVGNFTISVGTLLFPITYLFGDVIAEVYGYQLSRQLIWFTLLCELFFCTLITIGIRLPAPAYWHNQESYDVVLGLIFNVSLAHIIAEPVGAFVNAYAITKWKILLSGRFFWLRSLGATAIGELVFSVIAPLVVFVLVLPMSEIFHIMVSTYLVKLAFSTVSVIPASIMVKILKLKEGIDIYDYETNFNPLKLKVNWADEKKNALAL